MKLAQHAPAIPVAALSGLFMLGSVPGCAHVTPEQASANICDSPRVAAGMVSFLNSRLGKPDGPSRQVASIPQLTAAGPLQTFGDGRSSVSCHAVLVSIAGERESGTITSYDPGLDAPLHVTWETDLAMELRQAARLPTPSAATILTMPACADLSVNNSFAPVCNAVSAFCATSAPLACSLYDEDAINCFNAAASASTALSTMRFWRQKGVTARQAVELTLQGGSDAVSVEQAMHVSDTMTENDYRTQAVRDCLHTAAER